MRLFKKPSNAILPILAFVLLLAGCGFHLRVQPSLPFSSAYVEAPADSILARMLRDQLARYSKLAAQKSKADIIIRLSNETRTKSILSLSGAGKVQEYRLIHKVTVAASDRSGKPLLPPSTIQQIRDFSYNNQRVLAEDSLETTLHHEMDVENLQQIMRRLAYIRHP